MKTWLIYELDTECHDVVGWNFVSVGFTSTLILNKKYQIVPSSLPGN